MVQSAEAMANLIVLRFCANAGLYPGTKPESATMVTPFLDRRRALCVSGHGFTGYFKADGELIGWEDCTRPNGPRWLRWH